MSAVYDFNPDVEKEEFLDLAKKGQAINQNGVKVGTVYTPDPKDTEDQLDKILAAYANFIAVVGVKHDDLHITAREAKAALKQLLAKERLAARIDELKRAKMQGYISAELKHKVDRRLAALHEEANNG